MADQKQQQPQHPPGRTYSRIQQQLASPEQPLETLTLEDKASGKAYRYQYNPQAAIKTGSTADIYPAIALDSDPPGQEVMLKVTPQAHIGNLKKLGIPVEANIEAEAQFGKIHLDAQGPFKLANGDSVLVMQRLPNHDLHECKATGYLGKLTLSQRTELMLELVEQIRTLHHGEKTPNNNPAFHGDINDSNIIVFEEKGSHHLRLVDFQYARTIDKPEQRDQLVPTGNFIDEKRQSNAYGAPETSSTRRSFGLRTDVFMAAKPLETLFTSFSDSIRKKNQFNIAGIDLCEINHRFHVRMQHDIYRARPQIDEVHAFVSSLHQLAQLQESSEASEQQRRLLLAQLLLLKNGIFSEKELSDLLPNSENPDHNTLVDRLHSYLRANPQAVDAIIALEKSWLLNPHSVERYGLPNNGQLADILRDPTRCADISIMVAAGIDKVIFGSIIRAINYFPELRYQPDAAIAIYATLLLNPPANLEKVQEKLENQRACEEIRTVLKRGRRIIPQTMAESMAAAFGFPAPQLADHQPVRIHKSRQEQQATEVKQRESKRDTPPAAEQRELALNEDYTEALARHHKRLLITGGVLTGLTAACGVAVGISWWQQPQHTEKFFTADMPGVKDHVYDHFEVSYFVAIVAVLLILAIFGLAYYGSRRALQHELDMLPPANNPPPENAEAQALLDASRPGPESKLADGDESRNLLGSPTTAHSLRGEDGDDEEDDDEHDMPIRGGLPPLIRPAVSGDGEHDEAADVSSPSPMRA